MKNLYISTVLILFAGIVHVSAQNAITINPRTATINIGESAPFSVTLTIQSGFDASVFLSSTAAISPTIINYPYTQPIGLTVKTFSSAKSGVFTIYAFAKIGDVTVKDSCIVEVVNSTPFRIFNAIMGESRPNFVTLDNDGKIYYSLLGVTTDRLYPYRSAIWVTDIINPNFTRDDNIFKPTFESPTYNMLIRNDSIKYFFTEKGLYKYKNNELTVYNKSNSALLTDTVKRGVLDVDGRLWLGTPQGLASLENHVITRYNKLNSELDNEPITALAIGADNRLWIGTPNGLIVKDGSNWTRYTPQNSGLPAPYIYGLVVDNNGAVWMGSSRMKQYSKFGLPYPTFNDCPDSMVGLVKFNGTTWTTYNSTNSPLLSNYVNGLTIDNKGNLWMGTARNCSACGVDKLNGCGLLKYNGSAWTVFNTSNSLVPDNDVQWVGTDRLGNIWFTCKKMFGVMNEEGIPFLVNDVEEQPISTDGISIYPNPTSSSFTISGLEGVSSFRVMNSLGMEVASQQGVSGTTEVNVSDMPSGLYFVSIRTATGVIVKPIVVSH